MHVTYGTQPHYCSYLQRNPCYSWFRNNVSAHRRAISFGSQHQFAPIFQRWLGRHDTGVCSSDSLFIWIFGYQHMHISTNINITGKFSRACLYINKIDKKKVIWDGKGRRPIVAIDWESYELVRSVTVTKS